MIPRMYPYSSGSFRILQYEIINLVLISGNTVKWQSALCVTAVTSTLLQDVRGSIPAYHSKYVYIVSHNTLWYSYIVYCYMLHLSSIVIMPLLSMYAGCYAVAFLIAGFTISMSDGTVTCCKSLTLEQLRCVVVVCKVVTIL